MTSKQAAYWVACLRWMVPNVLMRQTNGEQLMYGSNTELPNRILSYKEALNKYNAIKPIRGRSEDVRPLARRSNDNLTIRQDATTGDVIIKFYQTDIITYDANGDGYNNPIHLEPYGSVLTNRVVWSILGPHVNTLWSYRYRVPGLITEVGGRYYHTPSFATVQPKETGWELTAGAKPVEVPYLNRKEGRQALRDNNYYTFKLWLETRIKLGIAEFGHRYGSSPFGWTPREAINYLRQGETGWAELSGRMSSRNLLEAELQSLREAIYKYEMCYDDKVFEYFESYDEYKNAISQIKRIG